MKNTPYLLLSLFVLLVSCGKKEQGLQERKADPSFIIDETYAGTIHRDTSLCNNSQAFQTLMEFNAATDYTIGVAAIQESPLRPERIIPLFRQNGPIHSTRSLTSLPVPSISINGEAISSFDTFRRLDRKEFFFGNTVTMEIGAGFATRSGEEGSRINFYIPDIIRISSPEVLGEGDLLPLCDYKSFILRWNADPLNEKGVTVVVEWYGSVIFGNEKEGSYVRCSDVFPDTGEALLSREMFDGIPDTGLCHMTVVRGNVENVLAGDYSYKFVGVSEEVLDFILIRYTKHEEI